MKTKIGINAKFIIPAVILTVISAGFLGYYTIDRVSDALENEFEERAVALTNNLAAISADKLAVDDPAFFKHEFESEDAVNDFLRVLSDSGFSIEYKGIDELNKLLENPGLYDSWNDLQKELDPEDRIQIENISRLVEKQANLRGKEYEELSSRQQNAIKRLNRIILEKTYPQKCPPKHLKPDIERLEQMAEVTLNREDVSSVSIEDIEGVEIVNISDDNLKGPFKKYSAPVMIAQPVLKPGESFPLGESELEMEKAGTVNVSLSLASLYGKISEIKYSFIKVILVALVFLTLAISFLTGRYIISPISDLIAAVRRVARGDLDYKIKVKNRDEIGALAAFFNKMSRDLKAYRKKIKRLAYHDDLTDLPNRKLLEDRIEHCLEKSKRKEKKAAVLFIDLDNFKKINDTMGHLAGNTLLKKVAARLKNAVRKSDTVSRYGGDEFVVLIEDIKKTDDVLKVAEKILKAFSEEILVEGKKINITPSMGISIYPDSAGETGGLIRKADIAMYRAKSGGKNDYELFR